MDAAIYILAMQEARNDWHYAKYWMMQYKGSTRSPSQYVRDQAWVALELAVYYQNEAARLYAMARARRDNT